MAIVVLLGLIFFVIARLGTDLYYKEVTQQLDKDVAKHIAAESILISNGVVNSAAMESLAHFAMVINPSIEVYLLDASGAIIAHAAPQGRVQRQRVDLQPLRRFIDGGARLPMTGEDPRDGDGRKIFSAAEVRDGDTLAGYVYVILGGEKYDALASTLQGSYIRVLSLGAIVTAVIFALIAGLLLFAVLTRRLRRLNAHVEKLITSGFHAAPDYPLPEANRDELDNLGATFNAMSRRIAEQVSQLEETDRLRRELISNVSHDLRTPLASMQGYIETLLIKDDTLSPEERKHYLGIARKHSLQLRRLIAELFELAKLDSGNVTPQPETFSLSELLQDVGQEFQLAASEKNVRLQIESLQGEALVTADIGLIQRVLENLIENALRYTPSGGTVRIGLRKQSDWVGLTVADTGCGITEEAMPFIFDRYYGSKDTGDSAGLGLAIVKRIVDLHGGHIAVESKPDAGTRFTVDLPVNMAAA